MCFILKKFCLYFDMIDVLKNTIEYKIKLNLSFLPSMFIYTSLFIDKLVFK